MPITQNGNCPYLGHFWAISAEIFFVTLLGMGNNVINPFLDLFYQNMVLTSCETRMSAFGGFKVFFQTICPILGCRWDKYILAIFGPTAPIFCLDILESGCWLADFDVTPLSKLIRGQSGSFRHFQLSRPSDPSRAS